MGNLEAEAEDLRNRLKTVEKKIAELKALPTMALIPCGGDEATGGYFAFKGASGCIPVRRVELCTNAYLISCKIQNSGPLPRNNWPNRYDMPTVDQIKEVLAAIGLTGE